MYPAASSLPPKRSPCFILKLGFFLCITRNEHEGGGGMGFLGLLTASGPRHLPVEQELPSLPFSALFASLVQFHQRWRHLHLPAF